MMDQGSYGRRAGPPIPASVCGFAFYGRISTSTFQDPQSSTRWQRDFAEDLIDGRGVIVAEPAGAAAVEEQPAAIR
jgi:hypothetical protein